MYYVYIYYHPDTMVPFYVGKGKGDRKLHHLYNPEDHYNSYMREALMGLKINYKEPIIKEVFHHENEDIVLDEETKLIKLYGRLDLGTGTLCNLQFTPNGNSEKRKGVKWTDEHHKNYQEYKRQNPNGKSVVQMDDNYVPINTFESIRAASAATGIAPTCIINVCKRKYVKAGGYRWRYEDSLHYNRPHETKRPVIQMDKNYNILNTFDSIVEASQFIKTGECNIKSVCKGRSQTAGGFIWAYVDEPIIKRITDYRLPIIQLDMDGNVIAEFESSRDASRKTGIDRKCISYVCRGKQKTAGKFKWKYSDSK